MGADTRSLVSVTREGGFVRSGPEVADEVGNGAYNEDLIELSKSDRDIQRRRKYDHTEPDPQQDIPLHIFAALLSIRYTGLLEI